MKSRKYKCHFCEHDSPKFDREICKTCVNFGKFKVKGRMSEFQNARYKDMLYMESKYSKVEGDFDRNTALAVLKDLSSELHPTTNLFGEPVLTIRRDLFEMIRSKWLDDK